MFGWFRKPAPLAAIEESPTERLARITPARAASFEIKQFRQRRDAALSVERKYHIERLMAGYVRPRRPRDSSPAATAGKEAEWGSVTSLSTKGDASSELPEISLALDNLAPSHHSK